MNAIHKCKTCNNDAYYTLELCDECFEKLSVENALNMGKPEVLIFQDKKAFNKFTKSLDKKK